MYKSKVNILLFSFFILFSFFNSFGDQIVDSTGIVMTDVNGNTYDLDSLLDDGMHIVVMQTAST